MKTKSHGPVSLTLPMNLLQLVGTTSTSSHSCCRYGDDADVVPTRSRAAMRAFIGTLLSSNGGEGKHRLGRAVVLALGLFLVMGVTGCQNVEPWQRGALADYTMRADRDPIGQAQSEHIFFSREEASGGKGVGGGGCGCN